MVAVHAASAGPRLVMRVLALVALLSTALAQAQTWHVECHGQLTVEDLFDGERPEFLRRQWRITVNPEAGYVKRPPELAAGCVEKKVEICGCEQSDLAVRCRSMGIAPDGTEIAMDFTLDRHSGVLRATGRRHHPASGKMIETTGEFACQAAAAP
jgi:hypothetical protein